MKETEMKEEQGPEEDKKLERELNILYIAYGSCFGMPLGSLLGGILGHMAIGTGLGVLAGIIVGACVRYRQRR